ncbi:hypothetical protein GW17_00015837 [Ensete ventricosum]|nr:hypothetical protein GW17_00015837 [Ensete ventricosum]
MVCGGCRQLLSYPRNATYVQCASCQTINLVLEAHQVGNVKCGRCSVLLMYPYGAPSVRCSSCCFITKIGVSKHLIYTAVYCFYDNTLLSVPFPFVSTFMSAFIIIVISRSKERMEKDFWLSQDFSLHYGL